MSMHWSNVPASDAWFLPVATLLIGMFSIAAIALILFHVFHLCLHKNTTMKSVVSFTSFERLLWMRYLTWTIIAPLFAIAFLLGPTGIALLSLFICWQSGREYALLVGPKGSRDVLILGGWITIGAVWLFGSSMIVYGPILGIFIGMIVALQVASYETVALWIVLSGVVGFFSYLYIGWLPAFLVTLSIGKTPGLVFIVGLGVALSDVGAFCVGKTFGGPQLAPHLSPNKKWSGVVGNVLGAALALIIAPFALPSHPLWQQALLVLTIGLGSVGGDLLESLLKRQHGVKDAGTLLPGFGGLLDRIDSLLLVAPLVYILSLLLWR